VQTGFAAALVHAEPTHFRHAAAFVTALPLGIDAMHTSKLVDSPAATTCIPWVDSGGLDARGYRLGATVPSGVPVRLDPFDTSRHHNANVAVLAASGHGKSFAIGALMLEAADRGVPSVVIDPEGEYSNVVAATGGVTVDLAPGRGTSVNIFDGAGVDLDGTVSGVVGLVDVLCGGVGEAERACVDAAARAACERASADGRPAVLADCLPSLESTAVHIATVVRRFCSGALGDLFNGQTTARLDRGTCSVSLRDLPDEHVPAATFVLARWLWELVRTRPQRSHIVFDEVGALCAHAPLRALLVQLARRCRKYGASLVVATQNARDLLATAEGTVVATNCATVLLGGHSAAETAVMQHAFGLTDEQRRFLGGAVRGEFLVLAGDRRTGIRIDVPGLHRDVLESRQPP